MDQETLRTLIVTLPLIIGAWAALRVTRNVNTVKTKVETVDTKVDEVKSEVQAVHAEVKSGNELKTGELASAAESRRIDEIPVVDRTDQEVRHIEAVPVPPKGHDTGEHPTVEPED